MTGSSSSSSTLGSCSVSGLVLRGCQVPLLSCISSIKESPSSGGFALKIRTERRQSTSPLLFSKLTLTCYPALRSLGEGPHKEESKA